MDISQELPVLLLFLGLSQYILKSTCRSLGDASFHLHWCYISSFPSQRMQLLITFITPPYLTHFPRIKRTFREVNQIIANEIGCCCCFVGACRTPMIGILPHEKSLKLFSWQKRYRKTLELVCVFTTHIGILSLSVYQPCQHFIGVRLKFHSTY